MADLTPLIDVSDNANVKAFLRMLRYGEGTAGPDGYRTMFGGGKFDSFDAHPNRVYTATLRGGKKLSSTAAGAYQFLYRTWAGLVSQYGFKDFSPRSQDLGAMALIKGRGALTDVLAGRFEQAVIKCNREWASLPGSPYGQPVVTMDEARAHYERHGGTYAAGAPQPTPLPAPTPAPAPETPPAPAPLPEPDPAPPTPRHRPPAPAPASAEYAAPADTHTNTVIQEKAVAPFIAAVLPSLISAIPELAKMFGSGSPTSERNVKAAEVVVAIAKDAIGAKNEQDLLEQMQANPEVVTQVREAVQENWFRLEEVGGGIEAARTANLAMSKGDGDRMIPFYAQPAFVVTCLLMLPVYFTVAVVLWPWPATPEQFSDEIKLVVVTAIISGLLSSIGGFWLGSSFGSQKKDVMMNGRVP